MAARKSRQHAEGISQAQTRQQVAGRSMVASTVTAGAQQGLAPRLLCWQTQPVENESTRRQIWNLTETETHGSSPGEAAGRPACLAGSDGGRIPNKQFRGDRSHPR